MFGLFEVVHGGPRQHVPQAGTTMADALSYSSESDFLSGRAWTENA